MRFLIAGLSLIGRRHIRNVVVLSVRDLILLHTCKATVSEDELVPFQQETDLGETLEKHKPEGGIASNTSSKSLYAGIVSLAHMRQFWKPNGVKPNTWKRQSSSKCALIQTKNTKPGEMKILLLFHRKGRGGTKASLLPVIKPCSSKTRAMLVIWKYEKALSW